MGKGMELNLVSASFERDPEDQKFERMVDKGGNEVFNGQKGFPQQPRYKDWTFGVLFLFHLALVIYPFIEALNPDDIVISSDGIYTLSTCTIICAAYATIISSIMFTYMILRPEGCIKGAIALSLNIFVVVIIIAFFVQEFVVMVISGILLMLCWAYALYNYERIPYIAVNFSAAIEVITCNPKLGVAAFALQLVAIGVMIVLQVSCTWSIDDIGVWMVPFYFLSYFWLEQVLKNAMHVTVASIVGKFWYTPDDLKLPRSVVKNSLGKAFSTSFGSICYGSLFVNSFLGMRNLVSYSRERKGGCWQCIWSVTSNMFKCMVDIFVYMNKWSFVYVGLYGYSFFQGGKNVTILFQQKGWKRLITDDLSDNIIFIINLAIATSSGLVGAIFARSTEHYYVLAKLYDHPALAGFTIGFFVSFVMTSVLFAVLGGAVNAVIVCFAESPIELQRNHPTISEELRAGWALELPNSDNDKRKWSPF